MDMITLLLMGIALAMDAFAVSISDGITLKRVTAKDTLTIAGTFGLFQGIMPVIGYLVANLFARQIQAIDHWVAFVLLVFLGGKMLWEVAHEGEEEVTGNPTDLRTLLLMAVATSIDALAVGVTMALGRTGLLASDYGFLFCSLIIAVVTLLICAVGVQIGCKTGSRFGKRAEIAGGLVLIGIGIKILLEHLLG